MENRQGVPAPRLSRISQPAFCALRGLCLLFPLALLVPLAGCAAPGEPVERKPPVPLAVSDLAAAQAGNSVVLTFTLPQQTVDRRPLEESPAIEIYRGFEPAPAASASAVRVPAHPTLLVTIPSVLVDRYSTQGRIRYLDQLNSGDFTQHPDSLAVYIVRTRASVKKESANSNPAALRVYPVPDSIADLQEKLTPSGVQLTWTPPSSTPAGPAPPIVAYRIYRALSPSGAAPSAAPAANQSAPASAPNAVGTPLVPPLTKIADTTSPPYLDAQAHLGDAYTYSVRSVVDYSGERLESADSNLVSLVVRDIFPPPSPNGLLVVFVPAQGDVPAHFDLSWDISPETDVAGYNVYRSEEAGVQGTRLNTELLPTPAFRDMNAQPGHRYFYSVTAVDRSGNESQPGPAVSTPEPAESQPTP
jgi:hypothetical protein